MDALKENGLKNILKSFNGVREESNEHCKMEKLQEQFCSLAKELLYGGYFLIDGKTRICLDDIEFYYHEEGEGGFKDPIMYHTNDHEGKEIPYFEIGRLNLHISGVDVTFENEEKKYRASFLIRGFHVENDDKPYNPYSTQIENYDPCSTHIYDKMLYMGVPLDRAIEIEWVTNDLPDMNTYKPIADKRYNVVAKEHFIKNAKNKYEKRPLDEEVPLPLNKDEFISGSSGKVYRRCTRQWRFYKAGINIKNK